MLQNLTKAELVIDVNNLKKQFEDKVVVKDISLQVKHGEIFGFIGPNGAGKTTTIRMLCGLLTPDGGSGTCLGYNILTQSKLIKYHMGYMSQYFGLYKDLTVYENLHFFADLYGLKNAKQHIAKYLDMVHLKSRKNQLAGSLSAGWKQRLSLAAALLHEPFLLLLDEPTANIDPKFTREFWELIHNLSDEGITILLSSQNMEEVQQCDRITYMCDGKLLFTGTIQEIIQQVNLTTWLVEGKHLTLLARQLQATSGVDQVLMFHDALHISSKNDELLNLAIEPYKKFSHFQWKRIDPTLEDIFVWLTS